MTARILGYCLMTNHVHLLAVPDRQETAARALDRRIPITRWR